MKVFLIFSALLLVAYAQHEFLGCYTDDADNRDLAVLAVDDSDPPVNNTVDSCVFLCGRDEWPYAGLQGSDCYCGFVYGAFGKAADAECRSKCPGDESTDDATRQYQFCGAANRNAIYSTGAPVLQDLDTQVPQLSSEIQFQPQTQAAQTQAAQTQTQLPADTQAQTQTQSQQAAQTQTASSTEAQTLAALAALAAQSSQSQSAQSQSSQTQSSQSQSSESQSSQSQPSVNQNFLTQVTQNGPAQLSAPVQNPVTQPQTLPVLNPPTDPFAVGTPGTVTIPATNPVPPKPQAPVTVPPKPQAPVTLPPKPVVPPRPPRPVAPQRVLCPICPYKREECGGPTRGTCNRQTGNCQCINGWAGGACGGRNGKTAAASYGVRATPGAPPPAVRCPVCPYKREECGGATRGTCNKQTGECVCKAPFTGGACSNRPGRVGAPGYQTGNLGGVRPVRPTLPAGGGAAPATPGRVLCPVCPYKREECGGPTRGTCNRQTGNCQCINGWAGGACGGRNGKTAAASYGVRATPGAPPPAVRCPVCPYKREECGGATRGTCNKQTGECVCKAPFTGGACSNRPGHVGAPGYHTGNLGGVRPGGVRPVRPTPQPAANAKCPICPYKREECGGATRGACNRQTGECVCKAGYSGGACSNHGGRVGAPGYHTGKSVGAPGVVRCPICPYRREECGGPTRGTCNRQTGNCQCVNGWSGGACGGRNGKVGAAGYHRATQGDGASFNGNYGTSEANSRMWMTSVGVLGAVVVVLFAVVIVLVVKLNAKDEERV